MKIITSESVFRGHPDKVCDQISDAILDAYLEQDKASRVAVETAIKDDEVFVLGEVSSKAKVDVRQAVLDTLKDIGYDEPFKVTFKISEQSKDIAKGVDDRLDHEQGAGDQGLMFGYACNETATLMPFPIVVAHDIARSLDALRKAKYSHVFGPDGKCQVSVVYDNDEPIAYDTIVVSAQTKHGIQLDYAKEIILNEVLKPLIGSDLSHINILINPTGAFIVGGPYGDSGLTGRKIIVDTYGGYSKHGGGAFSGKDVSKVDRSAAYYARFVAKAVVAANLADRCEVCVSYSIGVSNPISVSVETFGTGVTSDELLLKLIKENFNFSPASIIKELGLKEIKYKPLASYGHMGREDLEVSWENVKAKSQVLFDSYEKTKSTT